MGFQPGQTTSHSSRLSKAPHWSLSHQRQVRTPPTGAKLSWRSSVRPTKLEMFMMWTL